MLIIMAQKCEARNAHRRLGAYVSLVATPIPSVCCAPLTQKTAPLDEMISATSAVFLFYSVMLGVRVLIHVMNCMVFTDCSLVATPIFFDPNFFFEQ